MSTMQDHSVVTMSADKSTVLPRYDVVGCIYAPSREVAESRLQQDIFMDHAEIVYPAGQVHTITPDVLDTIRVSLIQTCTVFAGYLDDPNGDYFAGELWQIDRARRALGLED